MIAGLVTTTACNPADVVKTLMFVGEYGNDGSQRRILLPQMLDILRRCDGAPCAVVSCRTAGWHASSGTCLTNYTLGALCRCVFHAGGSKYSGPLEAAAHVLRMEGPAGFFKGWTANYTRLGPQTVITFLVAERLRALAGLPSL